MKKRWQRFKCSLGFHKMEELRVCMGHYTMDYSIRVMKCRHCGMLKRQEDTTGGITYGGTAAA